MPKSFKLRQLEGFAAAAREGSFVKAASHMSMTPPAFSQLIKELETSIGLPLFERTTRRIQLTQAGHRLLQNISRSLEELDVAYADMKEVAAGTRGKVVFSALHSLAFGPCTVALARFRESHPGIEVRMVEDENDELMERVSNRQVDFGVGMFTRLLDGLNFEALSEDRLLAVAPRTHELGSLRSVRWSQLAAHPLILLSEKSSVRRLVQAGLVSAKVPLRDTVDVKSMITAVNMVRMGLGVTVLPSIALPSLHMEGLCARPLAGANATRRIGIVRRERRHTSAAESAFTKLLRVELDAAFNDLRRA